ncbi:hypothetical protein PVBG_05702 [Plasmodium vivax Brazil I]|uniref:VIR protein n=1 Tax=Plasmodium vivax (strain Brazil I) TaxID=1033975 RepID=A0A0J9T069_PLAV1|nr:hypothetical protein PVBG_05702 [Plasmodium vivax Brazil I]
MRYVKTLIYVILFKFKYVFFDDIDNYTNYEEKIKSNTTNVKITECCTSFMKGGQTLKNTEKSKDICVNFLKLYEILPNVKENNAKDWGFLNYWLNFELDKVNKNICVKNFYDDMESHCDREINVLVTDDRVYNVKKDDLNKMNLLYGLYENYKKLDNILSTNQQGKSDLLSEYSNKFCSYYVEANYLCNYEDNKFCTHLQNFKTKYEGLYDTVDGKDPEYSKNFIKLTQCHNNTMSTALIGTTVGLIPLMFTPLRQLINSNKGKLTQEYRNNDDERRNIMLMDQGSEHISSQQGTYNIKYHSV